MDIKKPLMMVDIKFGILKIVLFSSFVFIVGITFSQNPGISYSTHANLPSKTKNTTDSLAGIFDYFILDSVDLKVFKSKSEEIRSFQILCNNDIISYSVNNGLSLKKIKAGQETFRKTLLESDSLFQVLYLSPENTPLQIKIIPFSLSFTSNQNQISFVLGSKEMSWDKLPSTNCYPELISIGYPKPMFYCQAHEKIEMSEEKKELILKIIKRPTKRNCKRFLRIK